MAEPCLDCPRVVPLVGEGAATGVAEHVRVRLEVEARGARCPLNHPGKAGRRERGSPLADEDKRRVLALPLESAQGPELVAAQGVGARGAVLDPPAVVNHLWAVRSRQFGPTTLTPMIVVAGLGVLAPGALFASSRQFARGGNPSILRVLASSCQDSPHAVNRSFR
jgi:hypothetical protein